MKTSCITHPAGDPFLFVRSWHLDACRKHYPAAVCLAIFELDARGLSPQRLPLHISAEVMRRHALGLYGHKAMLEGLLTLAALAMVSSYQLTPEEAQQICQAKSPQHIEDTLPVCAWCGATTFTLHDHHFPETRAEGGHTRVAICANCHAEYHWLIGSLFFRVLPACIEAMDAHPLTDAEVARLP
jgi:hypothetical protein